MRARGGVGGLMGWGRGGVKDVLLSVRLLHYVSYSSGCDGFEDAVLYVYMHTKE